LPNDLKLFVSMLYATIRETATINEKKFGRRKVLEIERLTYRNCVCH